eukprot:1426640-Pleurochrysis_carterae.AAC.1
MSSETPPPQLGWKNTWFSSPWLVAKRQEPNTSASLDCRAATVQYIAPGCRPPRRHASSQLRHRAAVEDKRI